MSNPDEEGPVPADEDDNGTGHDIVELKRRDAQLRASMQEMETLLRETHHRVKNNLQTIASVLSMQAIAARDARVERALDDAAARVAAVAAIHAQLSEEATLAAVDLRSFIHNLVSNVQRTFARPLAPVSVTVSVDSFALPVHLATPCALLVNELVTNAFRHAFGSAQLPRIEITAHVRHGIAAIAVRDNGQGFPPSSDLQDFQGLGLALMQRLVERQLRGELHVRRSNGTEFTITFPCASPVR
jgi:two-component sensor histidine kinase